MKYIFDLDETLINSTNLNNDAYNHALEKFGYNRIYLNKRITRENIKNLSDYKEIIKEKQKYFTLKWLPYRVILNSKFLEKLRSLEQENCFLWTKADKFRVEKVLKLCKLKKYFHSVIFDDKTSFESSIQKLKDVTKSNNLIIYENNFKFFENQKVKILNNFQSKYFNVNCYLIN